MKPTAALVLLIAAACCASACAAAAKPKSSNILNVVHVKNSVVPVTKQLADFKKTLTATTASLNKLAADKGWAAYSQMFVGTKSTKPTQAALTNYKANLAKVIQWNAAGKTLKHVYGLNQFTDMTAAQQAQFLGTKPASAKARSYAAWQAEQAAMLRMTANITGAQMERAAQVMEAARAAEEADSVSAAQAVALDGIPDWSSILPAVKNQGQCGSCWAFAVTAVTEAASYIRKSQAVALSEQDLVDCGKGTNGCKGSDPKAAAKYIIENGLPSEVMYPYVAKQQTCPGERGPVSRLEELKQLPSSNEPAMLEALKDGPILVTIKVDAPMFAYQGGVYKSTTCGGAINHAVVIVGAGVDAALKEPYWMVRNSWGPRWGEGGYIRISRGLKAGSRGMCGIAGDPWQVISADNPEGANDEQSEGDSYYNYEDSSESYGYANYGGEEEDNTYYDYSECEDSTLEIDDSFNAALVAMEYNTTAAKLMIDNELDVWYELPSEIKITCPTNDTWSPVLAYDGFGDTEVGANGLVINPKIETCPDGEYVIQIHAIPSQWGFDDGTLATWIGTVNMLCSDGTELKIDAQPDFDAGFAHGVVRSPNGFANISVYATTVLESLIGAGGQDGVNEQIWSCPEGSIITGMAGGASPLVDEEYLDPLQSFIQNFQLRCSRPFEHEGKVEALYRAPFERIPFGTACARRTYYAEDGNMFQFASKYGVSAIQLGTANPGVIKDFFQGIPSGTELWMPPCRNGFPDGAKRDGNLDVIFRKAATGVMRVARPKKGESFKTALRNARRV